MSKGIFVTATGTDVGKTYITAELIKMLKKSGINTGYYKAVLSGAEEKAGKWIAGDAEYVFKQADLKGNPNAAVTTILKYPASPHLSARMENQSITLSPILEDYQKVCERYAFVVSEGSGGIICPLNLGDKPLMLVDVIKALRLDVILVSHAGLGAINDVLLSAFYAKEKGIDIRAIILNHYDPQSIIHQDNRQVIGKMTGIKTAICQKKGKLDTDILSAIL